MAAFPALILLTILAAVVAADDTTTTTHLHLFMHDVVSGSNPTAVPVIKGPGPADPSLGMSFGDVSVMDDLLTSTSSPTSPPLGRMQGVYMLASQSGAALMVTANILLTAGEHNGSTLAVMGRDDTAADVRELAVVGGTGRFRMAAGYVLWRSVSFNAPDAVIELDVYLGNGANGTATVDDGSSAPGDGGSGSGSGGTSKSSSSGTAAAAARVTTTAWVVGVAVAAVVVGWCGVW